MVMFNSYVSLPEGIWEEIADWHYHYRKRQMFHEFFCYPHLELDHPTETISIYIYYKYASLGSSKNSKQLL